MNERAEAYRAEAAEHRRHRAEIYARSDTDGALSAWSAGISAELADARARIADDGGKAKFRGLYEGDRRVKARRFTKVFDGYRRVTSWLLHPSEVDLIAKRGKAFLPTGSNSRILKKLGLREREEWDNAYAETAGSGTGLSGITSVHIAVRRDEASDKWGGDAVLIDDDN